MIKVEAIKMYEGTNLLVVYPRQFVAQDVFVELDLRNGKLSAGYNPEIGNAVPSNVYHGLIRRYSMSVRRAENVNRLLEEMVDYAQLVQDGSRIEWDGHNHVMILNAEAQQAEEAIRYTCGEYEDDMAWTDAGDWLYESREEIKARFRQGKSVEDIADEEQGNGDGDRPVLMGLEQYLERLREEI
jgi:hypothetical protein